MTGDRLYPHPNVDSSVWNVRCFYAPPVIFQQGLVEWGEASDGFDVKQETNIKQVV